MFTGIVENTGKIQEIRTNKGNKTFIIESSLSEQLKTDQSLSHNGVCLTVENVAGNRHQVTAVEETLKKSNLGELTEGCLVNLERCMQMNGRIDGHIVQGHVDDTAICRSVEEQNGSWEYVFEYKPQFAAWLIEKGSICLNGISLTVFEVTKNSFKVAIIPYTYEHTNIQHISPGSKVNIEFDVIGKYIVNAMHLEEETN